MNKQRISFILCFFIALIFAVQNAKYVDAKTFYDMSDTEEASIREIIEMRIMQGDDTGRFRPDEYLTKAEATAIVTRLMGYENSYMSMQSSFYDVPKSHWASQTIGLATSLGLAKGDGNNFYPDKNLNSLELITMCLRVMGIGEVLDSTGNWPYAHIQFVNNEKILGSLTKSVYVDVTRYEAAKIISDFMKANVWEKNTKTNIYEKTNETIMSKYLDAAIYEDVIITEIDRSSRRIEGLYKDEEGKYTEELPYVYLPWNIDEDELMIGTMIDISVKGTRVLNLEYETDNQDRLIMYDGITDFNSASGYVKIKVDGRTTKYLFSDDLLMVTANGESKIGTSNNMSKVKRLINDTINSYYGIDEEDDEPEEDVDYSENDISGRIILDSNGRIVSMTMAAYEKIIWVKKVSSETITGYKASEYNSRSKTTLTSLNLYNKDYEIRDVDGNVLDIDDIEEGDVLLTTYDGEPYSLMKLEKIVNDKVTEIDDDDEYITIDGDDYYLNKKYCDDLPSSTTRERTVYLDQNDRIVGWE